MIQFEKFLHSLLKGINQQGNFLLKERFWQDYCTLFLFNFVFSFNIPPLVHWFIPYDIFGNGGKFTEICAVSYRRRHCWVMTQSDPSQNGLDPQRWGGGEVTGSFEFPQRGARRSGSWRLSLAGRGLEWSIFVTNFIKGALGEVDGHY